MEFDDSLYLHKDGSKNVVFFSKIYLPSKYNRLLPFSHSKPHPTLKSKITLGPHSLSPPPTFNSSNLADSNS